MKDLYTSRHLLSAQKEVRHGIYLLVTHMRCPENLST